MTLCTSSVDKVLCSPWCLRAVLLLGVPILGLSACANHPFESRPSESPLADFSVVRRQVDQSADGWSMTALSTPVPSVALTALRRGPLVKPVRYRLWVVPGSGCLGWVPLVQRYFAGLLHAELVVLHKPGVDPFSGFVAECPPEFVSRDSLDTWRDAAVSAMRELQRSDDFNHELPQLLLGISEGAELIPDVASALSRLDGVVMLSAPGLDPLELGELQAQRLGRSGAWRQLQAAQASTLDHSTVIEGRTLTYWRVFWGWVLAERLLRAPWPLLRVWGDADEHIPAIAYQRFAESAYLRTAPFCDIRLAGANHSLQSDERDGLQWLWAQLERWGRSPERDLCHVVNPRAPD